MRWGEGRFGSLTARAANGTVLPLRLHLVERLLTESELRSSLCSCSIKSPIPKPLSFFKIYFLLRFFPLALYGNVQIMRSKANNDLVCLHEEVSLGESLPGRSPGSAAGSDKGGVLNGTGLICLQCRQLLSSYNSLPHSGPERTPWSMWPLSCEARACSCDTKSWGL